MLSTFQKVWCWLGLICYSLSAFLEVAIIMYNLDMFASTINFGTFATIVLGILHVLCIAWLLFVQKKMAFYAIIGVYGIGVIVNMFLSLELFNLITSIIAAGLGAFIDWLVFRNTLPYLD